MKRYNVISVMTSEGIFATAPVEDPEGEYVRWKDFLAYDVEIASGIEKTQSILEEVMKRG